MARPSILIFALLVALYAPPSNPQRADTFRAYRARVDSYRTGTDAGDGPDGSGGDDLPGLIDRAVNPVNGWTSVELEAAAMLHTDVCLRLVKTERTSDAQVQLDAAGTLMRAAVARDAAQIDYAVRWRDTVSGLLEAYGARDLAKSLDSSGHEWWPQSKAESEARTAFTDGLTHEIRAAVAGRLSGPPPTHPFVIPPDATSALRLAAGDYERALEIDPRLVEAALHLGRVVILLGRDADGVPRLRDASTAADSAVRYLALMFLGAVNERGRRLDAAIDQYRQASEAFRWGQSAPLAISHALMRAGRDEDARTVLTDHFNATRGRACDPLWTYLADPATDLGPTLDELRAEIWR
jgi:tetratricopeptide (TPR) repeat protein